MFYLIWEKVILLMNLIEVDHVEILSGSAGCER